ncbi:MAG: hypothetical protein AAB353_14225 [Candidatus Hydrogenedentota bacterium]
MAIALVLVMPGVAFGQQIAGVTEVSMETAFDQHDALTGLINFDSDFDGFGVATRIMMASFGRLSSANLVPAAVVTAFNANRALATAGSNATLNTIVPGYIIQSAYLATIFCDTDGSSDAYAVIQGFADALGAPNGALTDLSAYDCTAAAAMRSAIFSELGFAQQSVQITGPDEVFIAFDSPFTAATVDLDNPAFSETHTFSSSNTAVMVVSAAGVARGVIAGSAGVVATGNTSTLTATKTVTVRAGAWFELCDWDDIFTSEGSTLTLAAGCDFFGTSVYQDVDGISVGADGVPDNFQVTLLAFVLCREADFIGPESKVSPPDGETVENQFQANTAYFARAWTQYQGILDWNANGLTTISITGAVPFTGLGGSIVLTASSNNVLDTTFNFEAINPNIVSIVSSTATTVTVKAEAEGTGVISATGITSGFSHLAAIAVDDITTNNLFISGNNDLNEGQTDTWTASTVGPASAQSYSWLSGAPTVATVIATSNNTALVTAILGTFAGNPVTITATGGVAGSVNKTIKIFLGENCSEAKEAEEDKDHNEGSSVSGAKDVYHNVVNLWATGEQGGAHAEVTALAGAPTAAALQSGIFNGLTALEGANTGARKIASALVGASAVSNFVVAQNGLTQETAGVGAAVFNGTGLGFPVTLGAFFQGVGGTSITSVNALAAAVISNTTALASPASAANSAIRAMRSNATLLVAATAALVKPVFNDLDLFIYGSNVETKFPGIDPFDDDTVFSPIATESPVRHPQDLTNQQYADGIDDLINDDFDGVSELGGDEYDFVALVTGEDLLAIGSPFLPAAGALALGLLAGGVAFSAARRLRRNK